MAALRSPQRTWRACVDAGVGAAAQLGACGWCWCWCCTLVRVRCRFKLCCARMGLRLPLRLSVRLRLRLTMGWVAGWERQV